MLIFLYGQWYDATLRLMFHMVLCMYVHVSKSWWRQLWPLLYRGSQTCFGGFHVYAVFSNHSDLQNFFALNPFTEQGWVQFELKAVNSGIDLNLKLKNINSFSISVYWEVIKNRCPFSIIELEFQFNSWINCLHIWIEHNPITGRITGIYLETAW